ncbi:MAG TPA: ATP-binding protein [Tepidisphaeraceae bacterium]|jgi:signal transduction histidine kinase|nr:ATP-binding protein [Tepidisphaeraceae bacterium]
MFKRLRQLRISLAAKCQILFGAAVLLIIGAALAVPWHRMEQLTRELNERTAAALAENAITEHVRLQRANAPRDVTLLPATQPSRPAPQLDADEGLNSPHLFALSGPTTATLMPFERKAIAHFKRHPDSSEYFEYYQPKPGAWRYRFAQPAFLTRQCAACHAEGDVNPTALAGKTTQPAVAAKQSPSPAQHSLPIEGAAHLAGVVTVDITSRIQESQLLLNRVFILGAGLLAGTLAILSFYLITTRLILQPVRVLQETAEKVSQGDLNIRSDINTGDEFQQLSETLNTMLANLKQSADQLRAVNKGLDLKLGQLAESNLALYESNRLKSEFLANVSHELRTPLNSILGFADLLKDAAPGGTDARSARYVNNILQSGRHLLDLINDLLDLAKIEAGKMEIRSEPISVTDLFEGLANILKPLTEAKTVALSLTIAPDVPIVWTDPGKLQQILYNFLSNAIKFSPPGSRIELAAQRERFPESGQAIPGDRDVEDRIRISVTDGGPGIAPEKQQLIFEKFRQIDASHTRTHGGTGLGLAISKELTTLLGGSIGVYSVAGRGATFWVSIPLRIESGAMDVRGRMVFT